MTPIFIKMEMANFGYDDVLLNWEITGNGRCAGVEKLQNQIKFHSFEVR